VPLLQETNLRNGKNKNFIHFDIKKTIPINIGFLYFITFIDDCKRYITIYLLELNSQAFSNFKEYRAFAKTSIGHKI
jgi:hypothetical protein